MFKDKELHNSLEQISLKLENISALNDEELLELKDKLQEIDTESISGLVANTTDLLEKISEKDKYSDAKMEEFLTDLAFQIHTIKESISSENSIVASDVIKDISDLKENSEAINQNLENISNLQNIVLTNSDFEEYQKKVEEEQHIAKEEQKNASIKNLNKVKEELEALHKNLSSQMKVLLEDILKQESEDLEDKASTIQNTFEDKASAIQKALEVLNKDSIEQTNSIVQEIKDNFTSERYVDCLDKVSVIYKSISKVDKWLSQFEDSIDLTEMTDKLDIVYENITVLNEWASKLDEVNRRVDELNEKADKSADELEDVVAKVDVIYDSISLMNNWALKIDNVSDHINDIKEKLDILADNFSVITTSSKSDVKEYIYTLLDIESDFAKLHCLINDSNKSSDSEIRDIKDKFESVQEDISSISKRTNKLIITSDNANKNFMEQMDGLRTIVDDLERKTVNYNPLAQTSILDKKISNIKQLVMGSLKSNQVVNEAFIHLGEWVDSADEDLDEIKESFENMQVQLENVQEQNIELKQKIDSTSEHLVSEMSAKLVQQEEKIAALEVKIDEMSKIDTDAEIKSVLDFIASQIISANENAANSKVLSQKMETMEHQLGKFEKNIARLVSYLDED